MGNEAAASGFVATGILSGLRAVLYFQACVRGLSVFVGYLKTCKQKITRSLQPTRKHTPPHLFRLCINASDSAHDSFGPSFPSSSTCRLCRRALCSCFLPRLSPAVPLSLPLTRPPCLLPLTALLLWIPIQPSSPLGPIPVRQRGREQQHARHSGR